MFRVVTLQQAHEKIHELWRNPKTKWVGIEEGVGKVLARKVRARIDFPPFDRAAMDGYAVRAADTFEADEENPVELKNLGLIRAGESSNKIVRKGTCLRIETGAPMPRGSDAVIPVEFTEGEKFVKVYRSVAVGENVIKRGSRLRKGEEIAEECQEITSDLVGILAAGGVERVEVFVPPKVGILSTGNELVPVGERISRGKVFDVNGPMLFSAVKELGCEATFLGIVRDKPDALKARIEDGLGSCDILIVTGGTSAGIGDLLPSSVSPIFHGLATKPGKPTLFAMVKGKPVFGLPGNPLSAFFVFRELVAPHLLRMSGKRPKQETVEATLSIDLTSERGREEFIPVRLRRQKGRIEAEPIRMGSDAITVLRLADGYIDVPLEVERMRAGERVKVKLLASR
jgi:molybdenum cofactor synthesis domain-containing protein